MSKERVYLAEITSIAGDGKLAWAKPLLESTHDQRAWKGLVENAVQSFPDKGRVFWFEPPHGIKEGELWEIEVEEHPQYDGLRKSEKYEVVNSQRAIEVIDVREWTENDLRRKLGSEGIRLKPTPLRDEIIFWTAKNRWIGPLDITQTDSSRWILEESDPTRLNCWTPGQDAYCKLQLGGPRLVVAPGHDFGERCGYANWAPDVEFATGVLKRIRKLDKSAYEALDVTYAVFEKYQEVLAASDLSGPDLQHERARLERIEGLLDLIESNEKLLTSTVHGLLHSNVVQSDLEKMKQEVRSEAKVEIERQMMTKLESERRKIKEIRSQIENKQKELKEVKSKVKEETKRLDEQVTLFESTLREKLNELASVELQDLFADSVILRTMLSIGGNAPSPSSSESHTSFTLWDNSREYTLLKEVKEAASLFAKQLIANDLGSKAMALDIFSAFLGSGAVCFSGSSINQVLDLFADTVAGGRLLWIPVPGGSIAPSDFLVSWKDGSISPHPNGLLETLIEAESSDELYLVVLEGFDRAPVESYLYPFLESLSESLHSDHNRRRVPLPAETTVAGVSVSRVAWPKNVMMACTPTGGTTANLPVSRNFWDSVSLVYTDSYEPSEISDVVNAEKGNTPTALGASTCVSWRHRIQENIDFAPLDNVREALGDVISATQRRSAESSYGAARLLGQSPSASLVTTGRLCILPHLAYKMDATQQSVLDALKIDKEVADAVLNLIRKRLS